jgi:hypothetical protein
LSDQPFDPISGAATALLGGLTNFMVGTASLPSDIFKAVKARKKTNTGLSSGVNTPTQSVSRASTSLTDINPPSTLSIRTKTDHSVSYVRDAAGVISKDWVHLLKLPRETLVNLGRGFHNLPTGKLPRYCDESWSFGTTLQAFGLMRLLDLWHSSRS